MSVVKELVVPVCRAMHAALLAAAVAEGAPRIQKNTVLHETQPRAPGRRYAGVPPARPFRRNTGSDFRPANFEPLPCLAPVGFTRNLQFATTNDSMLSLALVLAAAFCLVFHGVQTSGGDLPPL